MSAPDEIRAGSADSGTSDFQSEGGGAHPTPALRKSEWWVEPVSMQLAVDLVRAFHYARGGPNAKTYVHGLFRRGDFMSNDCHGIAWWNQPTRAQAEATYPENWRGVLTLTRFVLVPGTPTNAASFLLSRSRRLIDRTRWPCLVTYADTAEGHTGTIYRADNWEYVGLTKPGRMYRLHGRMRGLKGTDRNYRHAEMIAMGAECYMSEGKHKYRHIVQREAA